MCAVPAETILLTELMRRALADARSKGGDGKVHNITEWKNLLDQVIQPYWDNLERDHLRNPTVNTP